MFYSINAEDPEDVRNMQAVPGLRSTETVDLRLKSLQTMRKLIEADDLVGVKLFKMKVLSNLITHILPQNVQPGVKNDQFKDSTYSEVQKIAECLSSNVYREQLLKHSQDFKEEKKRLEAIVKESKHVELCKKLKLAL